MPKSNSIDESRSRYKEGNEYYEKGEFVKAISMYTKAIDLDPTYEKAYYNRGISYACNEQYDLAIADLKHAIELKPNFPEAYHILGLAYEYNNDLDNAVSSYNKALRLNPDLTEVRNRLDLALSKMSRETNDKITTSGNRSGSESKMEEGQIKEVAFLEKPKMNFKDVAGMEQMKSIVQKYIIWPFTKPQLAEKYGLKAGGGVLLFGPPGCGKTFIAKATAGECMANFINAKISEMVDMYAGNTEKNIHKIFDTARKHAPSIIFMDEVEGLGGKREGADQQQNNMKMAVNQLLSEMDGIESSTENVLIIAATNMPWDVDPALRRSGRFGTFVYVPPPDLSSRKAIFKLECRNKPCGRIAWTRLALATRDYSSADIKAIVKEAAMIPWEQEFKTGKGRNITTGDFIHIIKKKKSTLPPWYSLVEKEIVGKKETQYVDGKAHVTEKPSKIGPEEQETYKDLIKQIKKGSKFYWKWVNSAIRYFAIYVPIPF